jgi:hypothetical protein
MAGIGLHRSLELESTLLEGEPLKRWEYQTRVGNLLKLQTEGFLLEDASSASLYGSYQFLENLQLNAGFQELNLGPFMPKRFAALGARFEYEYFQHMTFTALGNFGYASFRGGKIGGHTQIQNFGGFFNQHGKLGQFSLLNTIDIGNDYGSGGKLEDKRTTA